MNLNSIVKNIKFSGSLDDREILYITHDSRKVKEGTLFIAIAGGKYDGHDYIFEAIDKGAIAVIANGRAPITKKVPILQVTNPRKIMSKIAANFYENPSKETKIIAVTGTNGKTTTTQIIDYILKLNNKNSSSLGTLGFSTTTGIISTGFTTPESIDLHQIIRTMVNGGIEYIPMEISSHAIKLHRVDDIDINIAIFTNLSEDHLDFHANIEEYFETKLKLFTKLNNYSIAILNGDDKYYDKIIKNLKCKHYSYGFGGKNTLSVVSYKFNLDHTVIKLKYQKESFIIKTKLIGTFNISNILAATLCLIKLNISISSIKETIESFKGVPGRLEQFKLTNGNHAIIDYAHSPDAFKNILSTIKEITNKKIITIFGCGGDRDKTKRPLMSMISEKYSYHSYITNDNPRFENEDEIIKDIVKGFQTNNYTIIKDRKIAIHEVLKNYSNSVIALLGKGRDDYQIFLNHKTPHSDVSIIKKYLHEN